MSTETMPTKSDSVSVPYEVSGPWVDIKVVSYKPLYWPPIALLVYFIIFGILGTTVPFIWIHLDSMIVRIVAHFGFMLVGLGVGAFIVYIAGLLAVNSSSIMDFLRYG